MLLRQEGKRIALEAFSMSYSSTTLYQQADDSVKKKKLFLLVAIPLGLMMNKMLLCCKSPKKFYRKVCTGNVT
jgi:hypothetical protein